MHNASHRNSASSQGVIQFATFRVAGMLMGVHLRDVQELMRCQEMATVPLAPAAVEGLINLRGQIVTALNMRRVLGIEDLIDTEHPRMNIIVRSQGSTVSLLVDEICDVLDVPSAASTRPPENLLAAQRSLLSAVYQLDSGLLLALDTEQVIAIGDH